MLLGHAFVYLQTLAFALDIDEDVPLHSDGKRIEGSIRVRVRPSLDGVAEEDVDINDPSELVGHKMTLDFEPFRASGLQLPPRATSTFVRYKLPGESLSSQSEPARGSSPQYTSGRTVRKAPVTAAFAATLDKSALAIEVWANVEARPATAKPLAAGTRAALSGALQLAAAKAG